MACKMTGLTTAACLLLHAYAMMQAGEAAALRIGCAIPAADDSVATRTRLHGTCSASAKIGSAGHLKEVAARVLLGQQGSYDVSTGKGLGRARIRARVASPHLRMRMTADSSIRSGIHDDEGGKGGYDEGSTTFIAECRMPTDRGMYKLRSYRYQGAKNVWRNGERVLEWTEMEPVVMYSGDLKGKKGVVVRVHDQCFTSEVMGSKRCDCKEQLDMALTYIQTHDGAVIYMPQEGRGIGLANKIAAYELQDGGLDTVDANRHLGFDDDERSYDCVPDILADMQIASVELVTNNPFKVHQLSDLGVTIDRTRPSLVAPNTFNAQYLRTKAARMAHSLDLEEENGGAEGAAGRSSPSKAALRLFGLESVRVAAAAMRRGRGVALVDGGVGYLVFDAALAQHDLLSFTARHTTGLIRVVLEQSRASEVAAARSDAAAASQRQGAAAMLLSAEARALAIRALVDSSASFKDHADLVVVPPDLLPVGANEEANDAASSALRLARLGGFAEAGAHAGGGSGVGVGVGAVVVPLLAADGGGGMDVEEAVRFATQHALAITSSADVALLVASVGDR